MQDLTPLIEAIELNTKQLKELTAKTNAIYFTLLETEHGQQILNKYKEWQELIQQFTSQADGYSIIQSALNPNDVLAEKLRQQIAEYRLRHPDGGGL